MKNQFEKTLTHKKVKGDRTVLGVKSHVANVKLKVQDRVIHDDVAHQVQERVNFKLIVRDVKELKKIIKIKNKKNEIISLQKPWTAIFPIRVLAREREPEEPAMP